MVTSSSDVLARLEPAAGILERMAPLFVPELRPLMGRIVKAVDTFDRAASMLRPLIPDIEDALETCKMVDAALNPPPARPSAFSTQQNHAEAETAMPAGTQTA